MSTTARIVRLGREVCQSELPDDVRTVAKQCVLDWCGVTLAGSREPAARLVFEQVCAEETNGAATLLGRRTARAGVLAAALYHGTAAHALDYDDTHWGLQGHPTAPILSAVIGLAERLDASGAALLAAFVAGVEVECRLGSWLNPSHYALGFHATATLGAFGAATAASHLLGLDEVQCCAALGLAGTQAAGLKSAFGSMAKPLQVGRAAQNGLLAAQLVAAGFTAPLAILDDAQGFPATHAALPLPAAEPALEPGCGAILNTLFKYHAACHLTHAGIDGVRALLQRHALTAADVRAVSLCVDPVCLGVCNIECPRTGNEGKFSLKATAALALLGADTSDPATFSDARMRDPALLRWLERVQLRTAAQPATQTEVTLQLHGGGSVALCCDSGIPARDLDQQGARLRAKFNALVAGGAAASALADCVDRLEHVPVRRLLALSAALGEVPPARRGRKRGDPFAL